MISQMILSNRMTRIDFIVFVLYYILQQKKIELLIKFILYVNFRGKKEIREKRLIYTDSK